MQFVTKKPGNTHGHQSGKHLGASGPAWRHSDMISQLRYENDFLFAGGFVQLRFAEHHKMLRQAFRTVEIGGPIRDTQ